MNASTRIRGGSRGAARRPQAGITLIEMLIALAIVGLLLFVGINAIRKVRSSALREDANAMIALLRNARLMATASGKQHRLVFDLEEQTMRIEVCEGEAFLERGERQTLTEEELEEAAELAKRPTPQLARDHNLPPELLEAASPEEAARIAGALTGKRVGGARCMPPEDPRTGDADGRGAIRPIQTGEGLKIRRVYVQHLEDPAADGTVSVNFFPLGNAEKAIIELGEEDGDTWSVLVHGLTGRIELRAEQLRDPEDHMLRNALGDREAER